MPGHASGHQRANLIRIAYASHLFGVDIAREEVLPAQSHRPVIAKICGHPGINVKAGIIVAIAAAVDVVAAEVVNRDGVVIEPGLLQFWRNAQRNRYAADIKLASNRHAVVGDNRRTTITFGLKILWINRQRRRRNRLDAAQEIDIPLIDIRANSRPGIRFCHKSDRQHVVWNADRQPCSGFGISGLPFQGGELIGEIARRSRHLSGCRAVRIGEIGKINGAQHSSIALDIIADVVDFVAQIVLIGDLRAN